MSVSLFDKLVKLGTTNPELRPHIRPLMVKARAEDEYILRSMAKRMTFQFRTPGMEMLWEKHIPGQISDGMWENSSGNSWVFWSAINTSTGGQTRLSGPISGSVRRNFSLLSLIDVVGEEMLETVQSVEPTATMSTVAKYLKEIQGAMSGADVSVQPSQDDGGGSDTTEDDVNRVRKSVHDAIGRPRWEYMLVSSTGSRSGKYHYFAVVGNSAYSFHGSMVGNVKPKVVPIGRFEDANDAIGACKVKIREKLVKGYDPVTTV